MTIQYILYTCISGCYLCCYHLSSQTPPASPPVLATMLSRAGVGVLAALPALLSAAIPMSDCREGEGSLYEHSLQLLDMSRNISLSEYEGKVVMLVNVATY